MSVLSRLVIHLGVMALVIYRHLVSEMGPMASLNVSVYLDAA